MPFPGNLGFPPPGPLVVAVVGATATGKSDLALDLAAELGGECVNADSMQLYRGMDIGTAKLPVDERRGIPHHLLDVLDPVDEATVAGYQRDARVAIDDVRRRGRHPVVVGGSGLYVRAALDHLDIPPTDPAVRARLETEAQDLGTPAAYARLRELDPASAERIQPQNTRRIVRALEVIELTGRPYSATMPTREHLLPTVVLALRVDRDELVRRIDTRVHRMWDAGLLDEVRRLEPLGLRRGRTASRALGYQQALAELDGRLTTAEAQEETAQMTRRLARRQESWFRPDPRIHWLDGLDPALTARAVSAVRAAISDTGAHG